MQSHTSLGALGGRFLHDVPFLSSTCHNSQQLKCDTRRIGLTCIVLKYWEGFGQWLSWNSIPLRQNSHVSGVTDEQKCGKIGKPVQLQLKSIGTGHGVGKIRQLKTNLPGIRTEEENAHTADSLSSKAAAVVTDNKQAAELLCSDLEMLKSVPGKSPQLATIRLVSQMQFQRYRRDDASDGQERSSIKGRKLKRPQVSTLVLQEIVKDDSSAEAVIAELEYRFRTGIHLNDQHLMAVLRALGKRKRPKVALQVWQWWRTRDSCIPNVRLYTMMLSILGNGKMIGQAFALLDDMRAAGCVADAPPYNALITALGRAGEVDRAVEVFRRMEASRNQCRPTVVTYGALLMTLSKAGRLQEALLLLQEMLKTKCQPNIIIFNTLISALGKTGDVDAMEELLVAMRRRGIQPNGITYTALIHAYRTCGRFHKVADIWEELTVSNCEKDTALYTEMISVESQLGRVKAMEEAFSEMCRLGIEPDKLTFAALITGFGDHGDRMKMDSTLRFMRSIGCQPDAMVYAAVLRVYGRRGLVSGIERTLLVMISEGCVFNRLIFEILIVEYGRSGLIERMESAVRDMVAAGFSLRNRDYDFLLRAFGNAGLVKQMEDTVQIMRMKKFQPSLQAWACMGSAYERAGLADQAAYARQRSLRMDS